MSMDINNADPVALVVAPPVAGKPGRRKGGLLWLLNARLAVGLVILLVMGLGSFILPYFAPADPSVQATYMRNLPMSGVHWLGTNALGQDIFWFLVFAIRTR